MNEIAELVDVFFNGRRPKEPKPSDPKTTDAPNIKLFMMQLINAYVQWLDAEGMRWQKTYRHRENGKQYTITIILEETP